MILPPNLMSLWLDNEAQELISGFWAAAGGEEPFPRTLEDSLQLALPVVLKHFRGLTTSMAEEWIRSRGRAFTFNTPTRALHGCMVAAGGRGFIFVDADDNPEEQRFTLAHEIAHYLADAVSPRLKASERLGPAILEVLDGRRPPNMTERVGAALHGITIGPTFDLMGRSPGGEAWALWSAESRADRLALALLAPPDQVLPHAQGAAYADRLRSGVAVLVGTCKLPQPIAERYAAELLARAGRGPRWGESLRPAGAQP